MSSKLLILSLLLVVVLSSCTGTPTSNGRVDFRTGNQALELRLLDTGVTEVYAGETFEVLVEFFNRGTADIANGEFFVSGYDLSYMTLALDPKYINIDGKDQFDPEGRNSQILEIRGSNVRLPDNSDEFTQQVKVIGCYDYTTYASAEICVDPDPNGRRVTKKLCEMTSVSPGPQGAPIVITYVEPIVSKNDFRLNIEFSNQNNGIVYDRTLSPRDCFLDLDKFQDRDRVDLVSVDFSGLDLTCTPNNPVRLIDGRGRITCSCDNCITNYMDAFKTQVGIELAYGYRDEIVKTVRILSD